MANITMDSLKIALQSVLAAVTRHKPNLIVTDPDDPRFVVGAEEMRENVSKAQETADEAKENADRAQETADKAQESADRAQETADKAQESADRAQATATDAQSIATEAKETAEAIKAAGTDWDQNDSTALDYIKNRTHYTVPPTVLSGFTDKLTDGTFDGSSCIVIGDAFDAKKLIGAKIRYAGDEVILTENQIYPLAGSYTNVAIAVSSPRSKELPGLFVISGAPTNGTFVTDSGTKAYRFGRTGLYRMDGFYTVPGSLEIEYGGEVVPLDEKYLPASVTEGIAIAQEIAEEAKSAADEAKATADSALAEAEKAVKSVNGIEPDEDGNVTVDTDGGVTSWNDLTDRPFYEGVVENVLYDEQDVDFSDDSVQVYAYGAVTIGDSVRVVVDGTEHNLVCTWYDFGIDGMGYLYLQPEDESFLINEGRMSFTDKGVHSVKVAKIESDAKTLDAKYLPENIRCAAGYKRDNGGEIFNQYDNSHAIGEYSHAEGYDTAATGRVSHAEGNSTAASGDYSHAEGYLTRSAGGYSHAEGYNTSVTSNGSYCHVEGYYTEASGTAAHAEGWSTIAAGAGSHAEGYKTATGESGSWAHAEGESTAANKDRSHAEGYCTIANGYNQHVQGKYNIADADSKYAHIVGNGTGIGNRSNAHTLDWDGNAWFAGTVEGTKIIANANDKTVKLYANEEGALVVEDADGTVHSVVLDDALNDAITTALQTAKDSGDFKGDKGDKGDKGEPPVKGTDYWTEEDKQEIVDAVIPMVKEKYELIETITLDEDMAIIRTEEPDGTPYNFTAVALRTKKAEGITLGEVSLVAHIGESKTQPLYMPPTSSTTERWTYCEVYQYRGLWERERAQGWSIKNNAELPYQVKLPSFDIPVANGENIVKISGASVPAGLTIEIWGCRA